MRALFRVIVCSLMLAPLMAVAMQASDIPPSPIAKAELLIDAPTVTAGEPMMAAVRFTMPAHWHIYWQNPGDSGIPTRLAWTLPEGLSAGDIAWPAPERIVIEDLVNYGYSNEVTLLVQLTPSKNALKGEVKLKASWLICKEICIPESAELTAPLQANAEVAALVAKTRALIPVPFVGEASFVATDADVVLTLTQQSPWANADGIRFSPIDDGIAANNPAPTVAIAGNRLTLTFKRGTADATTSWRGVLQWMDGATPRALEVNATGNAHSVSANATTSSEEVSLPASLPPSLLLALALAFIGGLVLNIMPCVLPILALKALSLSKKAQASRRAAAMQGISFTAGVVISFLVIAGAMLALKATGAAIGWGFQLQNPYFVGFLAAVMLLVAANLLGLFEMPVLFGERATGVDDSSAGGAFFTGVLSVLVATPCTAPFMATAIGATLTLPTLQALAVFAALGFGLAAPFLLISLWPAARRLLPKPGAWMHRFKQFLALPMLATAIWLIWVLMQLVSASPTVLAAGHEAYSATRLEQLRAEGKPVLVDATADWCISCKVNERVALKPEHMQAFLRDNNVTLMVADWTHSDPAITLYLASFGRNGVPLYVFYPAQGEPRVLPQILTPSIVREAIAGKPN